MSVGVGLDGSLLSGTLSAYGSNTNGNANWQSVGQQSGIYAGSGGYHVTVGGGLGLTSGVIGSVTPTGNSLAVAGPVTLSTLTNSSNQSIQSVSSGITISSNLSTMLMANAVSAMGTLAGAMGGQDSAQSASTPNIVTGCLGGTSAGGGLSCGVTSYGAATQGALANPNGNLASTIETQQETNFALGQASAAVAQTIGDLGVGIFGQGNEKQDAPAALATKAVLNGLTQAGLGAIAGESTSGIVASGLSGALADPLGAAVSGSLRNRLDQEQISCGNGNQDACSAADADAKTLGAVTTAATSAAGLAIGAVAGNVQAGEVTATSVVLNNYLTHAQLESRQTALLKCGNDQNCVTKTNTYYDNLSASQDLQMAIACQGDGLPSCSAMQSDFKAYVNGTAFSATGVNSLIGNVGNGIFGTDAIKLDSNLASDIVRSNSVYGVEQDPSAIIVNGATAWMRSNGINGANYGVNTLAPNSTEAKLYDLVPQLYVQDQATKFSTALGSATNGQRAIAAGEFQNQLNTIQTLATAEAGMICGGLSGTCQAGLTAITAVDCAKNPGALNCGAAALGIAVPAVNAVRAGGAVTASTVESANALTPAEIASAKVIWVDENASMSSVARDFNDSATGARSNALTQSGQAPAITRTLDDGTTTTVRFDGLDDGVLIDRKLSVVTTDKAKDQALRQSQALLQNGLTARWEVPSVQQAVRAQNMFDQLGITNITVKVVGDGR